MGECQRSAAAFAAPRDLTRRPSGVAVASIGGIRGGVGAKLDRSTWCGGEWGHAGVRGGERGWTRANDVIKIYSFLPSLIDEDGRPSRAVEEQRHLGLYIIILGQMRGPTFETPSIDPPSHFFFVWVLPSSQSLYSSTRSERPITCQSRCDSTAPHARQLSMTGTPSSSPHLYRDKEM